MGICIACYYAESIALLLHLIFKTRKKLPFDLLILELLLISLL